VAAGVGTEHSALSRSAPRHHQELSRELRGRSDFLGDMTCAKDASQPRRDMVSIDRMVRRTAQSQGNEAGNCLGDLEVCMSKASRLLGLVPVGGVI
jgi:hypothetical protein